MQKTSAKNLFISAVASVVFLSALYSLAKPNGPYKVGDVVNFTLHDANGKAVSLSQFRGKVVVLDFYGYY